LTLNGRIYRACYQCLGLYFIMFAYAAIPDFSCVVYETETEIETAVFPQKPTETEPTLKNPEP